MHFGYTEEQDQFRGIVARFLRERAPVAAVRTQMASASGHDPALWRGLAEELGLTGIHVPERFGGMGFGLEELCIAQEELGRALTGGPFFASAVLATTALLELANADEQAALLPALVAGERVATLAWVEREGRWPASASALLATPEGDAFRLNGHKTFVLDGLVADLILVVARTPGSTGEAGLGLYAVEAGAAGLARRELATLDATRRQAELRFTDCAARRLGAGRDFASGFGRVTDRASIALAAEMVGGARALLDASVEYAKLRMQFGRPIGAFQAVKHKLAELLLEVELATAAARYAAAAAEANDPETALLAAHAKAMASEACVRAAVEAVQIHGGIGFTWDNDTHLWFKRARSSAVLLGDAAQHRERYIALTEAAV